MKVLLGDVFTLPTHQDRVVVGQVVQADSSSRQVWVAIYWPPVTPDDLLPRLSELISGAPVLLAPTLDLFIHSGRWTIVHNSDVVAPIRWPAFKEAFAPGSYNVVDHDGKVRRRASSEEVARLPFRATVSPAAFEVAAAALGGAADWNDAFNLMRPGPNTETEFQL